MAPVSCCPDVGHLWKNGHNALKYLEHWLPRARVVHLHGVAETDHQSLSVVPAAQLDPIVNTLNRHFRGVVTLEVFNKADFLSSVEMFWNSLARFGFFAVVTLLLAAQRRAHAEVLDMARTDFLTGVTSQRYFYELAQIEIDRSRRYRHPVTLAYIDLDNFKDVNDRLGHVTGDALLRVVAGHIRRNTRSVDVVARIGGDEFVLLLPETGVQPAQAAVSKIMSILTQAMRQNEWPVSFSIGVVTFLELPPALEEMLDMADSLMRSVKADSKNGVRFSVYPGLPAA